MRRNSFNAAVAPALAVTALLAVLLPGCDGGSTGPSVRGNEHREIHSAPLADATISGAGTRFERLDESTTGISFVNQYPAEAVKHVASSFAGGGVCIGDYDGDGFPDVYLTNQSSGNRLYRNLGGWRFKDVTDLARVGGDGAWCSGATFVDIDNDDDLDLYVCTFDSPNRLYVNQGDGTFSEEAGAFGLDFKGAGRGRVGSEPEK